MKIAAIVGTSILGLFLGTTTLANAQQGRGDDRKGGSDKHQEKDHQKEHGKSSKHSDRHEANGPGQRHEARPHEQARTQNRSEREQSHHPRSNQAERGREANRHEHESHARGRDVWQDHRARHWQGEHRGWRERGGYHGYRIPEDRFRAHFGRGHWFRVYRYPVVVVGGYPRFQYQGFWFSLVDPWPEYWASNWYETDDVYVDYVNDGYYMYNRRHPGVAIAVNVSF